MFVFLAEFPLALPMSILTLAVLWIFFVAGADAGTIVLGSLSTGGPPEPKRWIKLAWGLAMALIAGILLLAGGLGALQSASVLTGLPFAFIMVLMCVAFYKHLRTEARELRERGDPDFGGRTPGSPTTGQAFTAENPNIGLPWVRVLYGHPESIDEGFIRVLVRRLHAAHEALAHPRRRRGGPRLLRQRRDRVRPTSDREFST